MFQPLSAARATSLELEVNARVEELVARRMAEQVKAGVGEKG